MSVKRIVHYPDDQLLEPCKEVVDFKDPEFLTLVTDLVDTAKAYKAQGLAANQIRGKYRVFVSCVDEPQNYKVFVNPKLVLGGPSVSNHEGCLSFPGAVFMLERPEECTVTAQNELGDEFELCVDDVESVAIQHEADHLDGKLMIDRMTRLEKRMFLKKVNKYKRKYMRRF